MNMLDIYLVLFGRSREKVEEMRLKRTLFCKVIIANMEDPI